MFFVVVDEMTRTALSVLQLWRQVYLLTILSLILAVFCAQVHPNYLNNDWRRIRVTIFCCVAGISVVPACHWVWLNDGFASDVVQVTSASRPLWPVLLLRLLFFT